MKLIEALYIFDEHNHALLEHVYAGRPPSASTLLDLYLNAPPPTPNPLYLTETSPPTLLFSLLQDRLLFLAPVSNDVDPLSPLEFLYRVADTLEDFLGPPLLGSKIEQSFDVVVQVVGEICDAGIACSTEPNVLKDVVEVPNWMGSLLGNIQTPSLQTPSMSLSSLSGPAASSGATVPWRRANVKHTSNELYVDIVENLSVTLAPSGRPLAAFAKGMVAFTAKISGVPDLLLRLTAPGGRTGLQKAMDMPTFHQCVRLTKWKDQPGELSFVPPDGRFILAGYECDLLSDVLEQDSLRSPDLKLPASIEMLPCVGINGDELEIRLLLPLRGTSTGSAAQTSASRSLSAVGRPGASRANSGESFAGPAVEDICVSVPISAGVRNIQDIRCSKGEANFSAAEASLEWRISTREAATMSPSGATLRCTIVGLGGDDSSSHELANGLKLKTDTFDYDEDLDSSNGTTNGVSTIHEPSEQAGESTPKSASTRDLMPTSASLSFAVRGWLASGIKVDSLSVNTRTSKGLGSGVTPYKGVKYHTISRQGIEMRA